MKMDDFPGNLMKIRKTKFTGEKCNNGSQSRRLPVSDGNNDIVLLEWKISYRNETSGLNINKL